MLFHHVIHDLEDWRQVFQDPDAFAPLIREIFRRHGLPFAGIGRWRRAPTRYFAAADISSRSLRRRNPESAEEMIFLRKNSGSSGQSGFLSLPRSCMRRV